MGCVKVCLVFVVAYFASLSAIALPTLPAGGSNCELSDLTTSVSCLGVYDPGNDQGAHNIFSEATFISTYGIGWSLLSKVEDPSWGTGSLGLTLPSGQGTTSGTWSVNSNAWDGYAQGEILAVLKAGSAAAAYMIDVSYTSGTWNVAGSHWESRKNNNLSGLSHFSFWTKASTQVSEPGTLALLGLGLVGLVLSRKRAAAKA